MSQLQILEGCEEFALGEGPVGALLVHGYTGSPQGMRGLGEFLSSKGINCVGPRLPGHGTTWQDLNARTQQEWRECVESNFDALKARCDEVFIVSLSFGSALCLELAAKRPDEVAGLVSLAGIVFTKDPRRHLAPVIRRVLKSLPGVGNDIADPDMKELAYDRLPTTSTYQMLRQLNDTRAVLPQVTCPILVMHGRGDHTVHPDNAQYIYDNVGSTDKELIYLERSYHVITLDLERDVVFEAAYNFIKERSKHAV